MRMLISQTPVRLSMGGGGTDVAAYYQKHGGFWTAATINQYVYLTVNIRVDDLYVVKYSNVSERVTAIPEIAHDLVRETLLFMGFGDWRHRLFRTRGLEINVISDVPTRSGLGVSGAMTVGLLQILHQLRGDIGVSLRELAEEAYHIEHDRAGASSVGKQDQYIAALGGITSFEVDPSGRVATFPLELDRHTTAELEGNLVLFGTRLERQETARQALQTVTAKLAPNPKNKIKQILNPAGELLTTQEVYLTQIKEIGLAQREALLKRQPHRFGELLDHHWQIKKKYAGATAPALERAYVLAKKAGALGGKVVGASTKGAYMIFYCPKGKDKLRLILDALGMIEVPWVFDFAGSRIVHTH